MNYCFYKKKNVLLFLFILHLLSHSFFRLLSPEPRDKFRFPRFGSKFRYSGRTQHQAQLATRPKRSQEGGGEGGTLLLPKSSQSAMGLTVDEGKSKSMTAIGERQVAEGRSKRHTLHGPDGVGGDGGAETPHQEGRHSRGLGGTGGGSGMGGHSSSMMAPEPTKQTVLEATREQQKSPSELTEK